MKFTLSHTLSALLVAASLSLVGCQDHDHDTGGKNDPHKHGAADHPEEGPHKGHLIELGKEEYHAEVTHDEATKTVTIYLLDGAAKKAVPIPAKEIVLNLVVNGKPTQAKLAATPLEGEPAGQSSRFSIVDEAVLEALEAPKTTGKLNVTIAGKPFVGNVEHHEHEDKK